MAEDMETASSKSHLPQGRGRIRWGLTFALTISMVAVLIALAPALWLWLGGRGSYVLEAVSERSEIRPGQMLWCPLHSDDEAVELERIVSTLTRGRDGLRFMVTDAWGYDEFVLLADDQIHYIDLADVRLRLLPDAVTDESETFGIGDLVVVSAPLEPAVTKRIEERMIEAVAKAVPLRDQLRFDEAFDGFGLELRVGGWLCAYASTPPPDSEAGRLREIMSALIQHVRLQDPEEAASSAQRLRDLVGT